jgi:hypothetical protein
MSDYTVREVALLPRIRVQSLHNNLITGHSSVLTFPLVTNPTVGSQLFVLESPAVIALRRSIAEDK